MLPPLKRPPSLQLPWETWLFHAHIVEERWEGQPRDKQQTQREL